VQPPEGHPFVHEPAPPEPRRLLPERGTLVRGIGLCAMAAGFAWAGVLSVQKLGLLAAPLVAVLGAGAALAGWAAAVHLTGGELFDDHPWV
jgi:hypothetical protein